MGLLDRNKRRGTQAVPDLQPVQEPGTTQTTLPASNEADDNSLRDMLVGAVAARDGKLLTSLIAANRRIISLRFPDWQRIPDSIRENEEAMKRYAAAILAIAEFYRDRLDDPSLITKLTGPGKSIDGMRGQWEQALGHSDSLMREGKFDEAADLLRRVVTALQDVPLDTPIPFHAVTHSRLAQALFAKADIDGAMEQMRHALELSETRREQAGIAASVRGMYEINRYAGRTAEAAGFADRIGAEYAAAGNQTDATWWTKQAALVRVGEPPCRVVFFANDRQYEVDDPPANIDASLRYGFVRNRPPIQLADMKVHQGMQLAAQGKYAEALNEFADAAKIDPHDPNPHVQSAMAMLHLDRYQEAVEAYDRVEQLAPGWMNTRSARWIAAETAAGHVDPSLFSILATEEMPTASIGWDQKLQLVEQAIARNGELPPLLHYKGRCLMRLNRATDAEAVLRSALEKSAEPDLRTRVLVDLQYVLSDPVEKKNLLDEAVAVNGNLIAAAIARIELLSLARRQSQAVV